MGFCSKRETGHLERVNWGQNLSIKGKNGEVHTKAKLGRECYVWSGLTKIGMKNFQIRSKVVQH